MNLFANNNQQPKLKKYRILYNFNHSRMGFQNSITLTAFNVDEALKEAEKQVAEVYGTAMLKKFSFKPDAALNGVVI